MWANLSSQDRKKKQKYRDAFIQQSINLIMEKFKIGKSKPEQMVCSDKKNLDLLCRLIGNFLV